MSWAREAIPLRVEYSRESSSAGLGNLLYPSSPKV